MKLRPFYELYAKRFKEIFVCAEININTWFDKTILCFNREKIKRNASAGRSLCGACGKYMWIIVHLVFESADITGQVFI